MDLNTILIILGSIAAAILIVHGIWLNRQNKSKIFDSSERMESTVTQAVLLETEKSDTDKKTNEKTLQQTATGDECNTFTLPEQETISEEVNFVSVEKASNTGLNADLSHIKISLRSKNVYNDCKIVKDKNELSSTISNEQLEQSKKTISIKDIEMPAMPKDSSSEENIPITNIQIELKDEKDLGTPVENTDTLLINEAESNVENVKAPLEEHQQQVTATKPEQNNNQVIVIYVVAPENSYFKGNDLQQALDKEGFLFGAKSIYHRHSEFNCHSPVLFSLANVDGHGEFDIEKMAEMRTFGVALFMETPVEYGTDRTNLRFMINSAKALAKDLNGYLLSDKQEPFNFDVEQEYLSRVV